jgi:ankyrin repeat protein
LVSFVYNLFQFDACMQVEVNFMDDVGQTLLNWASAFGTQEMVEFLCAKGTGNDVPGI